MKKCNLCYDRTVQGLKPGAPRPAPHRRLVRDVRGILGEPPGRSCGDHAVRTQDVHTRVYHVLPAATYELDVLSLLREAAGRRSAARGGMGTVTEVERRRRRQFRQREASHGEFPYEWEHDAAVSRRELLRLVLAASVRSSQGAGTRIPRPERRSAAGGRCRFRVGWSFLR